MNAVLKELAEKLVEGLEVAAVNLVEAKSDEIVDKLVEALEKAIPGTIDDIFLDKAKPVIQATIKAELLKLAHQISAAE